MFINLLEIPDEGKTFICNNQTGELNAILADLVGKIPHKTEFFIKPLAGGTFELTGDIQTQLPEQCSRCGIDFNFKVNEKFKELMIPELDQPRNAKYSKANHFSEMSDDLSVVEYQGHKFDIGEYLHEVVALSLPAIPAAPLDEKDNCTVCHLNKSAIKSSYNEDLEAPTSPFAALKGLKLN